MSKHITLTVHGPNQISVELEAGTVFFSHNIAVAGFLPGHGYFATNEFYSQTTSRHINAWTGSKDRVDAETFKYLMDRVHRTPLC